ncbi:hypothetical protein KY290_018343 [Solanum tuberosum]|uniref:Uncharacterized protein n=2 Tax=Solanum tuberosum TaxID=4113 RepID=A0ABQ7VDX3_SOLTU|nr:hypothetical protein KY284_017281 [Solanum tuberosum]KAH0703020.1 hypothetical protein KY285_017298 [Solanum tuberosum]KAH0762270.1 hypothetical protein KY290_018343 [Solanum tuberosum]
MIRLLDPGLKDQNENCSVFPDYRANYGGIQIFQLIHNNNSINYVNCRTPINSSQYIPTTFCRTNTTASNGNFSYLVLQEIWQASDLANGCKVETVAWSSAPGIFTQSCYNSKVFVLVYGGIGIGAIMVLRFLVGIPILIAVVVWQCKSRNLNISNDNALGDKASSSEQNC